MLNRRVKNRIKANKIRRTYSGIGSYMATGLRYRLRQIHGQRVAEAWIEKHDTLTYEERIYLAVRYNGMKDLGYLILYRSLLESGRKFTLDLRARAWARPEDVMPLLETTRVPTRRSKMNPIQRDMLAEFLPRMDAAKSGARFRLLGNPDAQ